ncbi:delta subunit of the central stalk of mitochondrial F1F0 ATP synthase, atp16 [Physocladia obscura]|uniref:ATP synthase subunit delta, mitochondrial n=1 Tax=Physocladia obscura TaxID=109957 RepID=A0AAD5T8G3_9FUNG|nr:delta subunit of the central stalk of mitochondrial F1F0 ATP synthase, atp16 [Physocladia obscura]
MRFLRSIGIVQRFSSVGAISRRSYATETNWAGKIRLNFVLPHQTLLKDFEATQVNLQSSEGDMGILADHVPTIAQLNNGSVIEILAADNKPRKFFVSGGFAVINTDSSIDINAIEAVPLEDLDVEAARKGADEASKRLSASGASEKEKAEARVEFELFEAVLAAAKA